MFNVLNNVNIQPQLQTVCVPHLTSSVRAAPNL